MAYFVIHKKSAEILKIFNSHSSAKRSMTCMNRNSDTDVYAVAEEAYYNRDILWRKKATAAENGQSSI